MRCSFVLESREKFVIFHLSFFSSFEFFSLAFRVCSQNLIIFCAQITQISSSISWSRSETRDRFYSAHSHKNRDEAAFRSVEIYDSSERVERAQIRSEVPLERIEFFDALMIAIVC